MRCQVLILRWNSSTVCCDFIQNDHLVRHFTSGEFRSVLSHLLARLSSTWYIGFMHYGLYPCVEVSIVNKGSVWWFSPVRLQLSRHADTPHFSVVWHGGMNFHNGVKFVQPIPALFYFMQHCIVDPFVQLIAEVCRHWLHTVWWCKERTDVGSKHCVAV